MIFYLVEEQSIVDEHIIRKDVMVQIVDLSFQVSMIKNVLLLKVIFLTVLDFGQNEGVVLWKNIGV